MVLNRANETAEEAHRGQTRSHGAPYVDHPRAVARFVDVLCDAVGFEIDDQLRATALLHDVIEDSDLTEEALRERFGPQVASRVAALSKPPKDGDEPKAERSHRYFSSLHNAEDAVRLIKVADRLHNLLELPLTQDPRRQERYLAETIAHVLPLAAGAQLPGVGPGLSSAVTDAVNVCARLCGLPSPADGAVTGHKLLRGVYPIVDVTPDATFEDVLTLLDAVCEGGANVVQLRCKGLDDRRALSLCESAVKRARAHNARLIINDRADLALLSKADGLHVGTQDVPAARARELLTGGALLGTSTHTTELLEQLATSAPLDYVALGPVFESPTKSGHADVTGLDTLAAAARATTLPVVAIGGITTPARMAQVARSGAAMGAVVSAVASSADPMEMTRALGIAWAAARGATARGATAKGAAS